MEAVIASISQFSWISSIISKKYIERQQMTSTIHKLEKPRHQKPSTKLMIGAHISGKKKLFRVRKNVYK